MQQLVFGTPRLLEWLGLNIVQRDALLGRAPPCLVHPRHVTFRGQACYCASSIVFRRATCAPNLERLRSPHLPGIESWSEEGQGSNVSLVYVQRSLQSC